MRAKRGGASWREGEMSDMDVRLECLRLAMRNDVLEIQNASDVLSAARAFYDFIVGAPSSTDRTSGLEPEDEGSTPSERAT